MRPEALAAGLWPSAAIVAAGSSIQGALLPTRLGKPRSAGILTGRAGKPYRCLMLLLLTTLCARLLFAVTLGLGVDESYMVASSRALHPGYFDHPPVAWWIVWAATHLAGSESELVVRLPFVLLFTLSTWLMFRLAADLYDTMTGLWSAVLLNAVPVLGITAGSWVLPDGPLIAALLGAGLCLVRALPANGRGAWGWWLGAGACFGLALCSKYTAILTAGGAGLFLLTTPGGRRWLRRPLPYAAALVALALFSPVIAWNARHGWVSLLFQGSRAHGARWHPFGPLSTLGGEALFFMPWIFGALLYCLWRAARTGPRDGRGWLLLCLSVPSLLVFVLVSLRGHVLFHWAAPGLMMGLPLVGDLVVRHRMSSRPLRAALLATAILLPLGAVLVGSEVRYNWMPDVIEDFALGNDPDLDAVDWANLRDVAAVRRISASAGLAGAASPGVVIGAIRWHDAGKIDYVLGGRVPVICLGSDPREYGLADPASAHVGQDVLIVAPRETLASIDARYGGSFDRIESLPAATLLHHGKPAMMLPLFLAHRLHDGSAAAGGNAGR